ncbi:hypothetical protein HK101_003714 [Irineochytrium annulatum]|nr:hypothetical protein HK101_003714 [Irineochytrium annulatum]
MMISFTIVAATSNCFSRYSTICFLNHAHIAPSNLNGGNPTIPPGPPPKILPEPVSSGAGAPASLIVFNGAEVIPTIDIDRGREVAGGGASEGKPEFGTDGGIPTDVVIPAIDIPIAGREVGGGGPSLVCSNLPMDGGRRLPSCGDGIIPGPPGIGGRAINTGGPFGNPVGIRSIISGPPSIGLIIVPGPQDIDLVSIPGPIPPGGDPIGPGPTIIGRIIIIGGHIIIPGGGGSWGTLAFVADWSCGATAFGLPRVGGVPFIIAPGPPLVGGPCIPCITIPIPPEPIGPCGRIACIGIGPRCGFVALCLSCSSNIFL